MSTTRYINRFLQLRSAPDLLALNLYPNVKEITESMGAFVAIKDHIPFSVKDPTVTVFVVGDGHVPRTGALIARLTAWTVYSIDPKMRLKEWKTQRLETRKSRIEETSFHASKAIIVSVHSHAKASLTIQAIHAQEKWFVNIPCCIPCDLDLVPLFRYNDTCILSPKNEVSIYDLRKE